MIKSNLKPFLLALLATTLSFYWISWSFEDYPYSYIDVSVKDSYIDEDLVVEVNLFRNKSCPYILERKIVDSSVNKIYDDITTNTEPTKLGEDRFLANISYKNYLSTPSEGRAVYYVRVSSMCNPFQKIFLNEGEWIKVPFVFKGKG